MTTLERIEAEALALSTAERSRLVERLLASLDEDDEVAASWALEVGWSSWPSLINAAAPDTGGGASEAQPRRIRLTPAGRSASYTEIS